MKRVFSTYSLVDAHHARNVLRADGISAVVRNEYLGSALGELPPAECQIEVWVTDPDCLERAEQLMRSPAASTADAPWSCAVCGEPSEPQFTQCWRCGGNRAA